MFKTITLYRIFSALIFIIAFCSCDDRKSVQQAIKEDIQNFKKKTTLESFFPEADFVSYSDTLLDSGYRIQLKTIPDLNNAVLVTTHKDAIKLHKHFRNFIFDMYLYNDKALIMAETFDKKRLEELISRSKRGESLNGHVLKSINVNLNKSSKSRFVLDLIYYKPISLEERYFEMILDPKGHFELQPS